jgi:hypothetical protein
MAPQGSIRAIWAVRDKIALNTNEEKAIAVKRDVVGGQERLVWNADLLLPVKEFDFSEPEVARIKAAIQTWDSYGAAADRHWLEPLVVATFDRL